jgi:rare lipoprotein A (peptidoglycan hydrolase)
MNQNRWSTVKKTRWIVSTAVAGVLAAGGGGTAFAVSNEAEVTVYGESSTVRTFSPTVGELLEAQGVEIKPTDLVTPDVDETVTDGMDIDVVQQRAATITVDGEDYEVLTSGTTVQDAIDEIDFKKKDAKVSPAPDTELSDGDNAVTVSTLKEVTFKGQRGKGTFDVYENTVGEAMEAHLKDIDLTTDSADVELDSAVEDGQTITVKRVRTKEVTKKTDVEFETKTNETDDLYEDETEVKTEGQDGTRETVYKQTIVDGKVKKEKKLDSEVTEKPVTEVVLQGTKERPVEDTSSDDSSDSGDSESNDSGDSDSSSSTDQGGEASGDVTTCTASHYGENDGTDGGPTASGETFDAWGLTAAHKTLPLGTRIKVTNTANGKSVVVKVNDRGPYIGGRCLDLSAGAFSEIGDLGSGTMTVSYQKVG